MHNPMSQDKRTPPAIPSETDATLAVLLTGTRDDDAEQVRITSEEIAEARWWSDAVTADRDGEWFVVVVLDVPEPDAESVAEQAAEHGDLMIRYLDRWAVLIRMNVLTIGQMLARRWLGHIPDAGFGVADSRSRTGPLGSKMPLADMLAVAYAESLICRTGA